MAFDWSNVGGPPPADVIEIAAIGPGFGESIVIHVGNGHWVVVDSCIDSKADKSESAPLLYLKRMGVDPARQVDLILATHWHRDHVRGLAQLVRSCPNAKFSCGAALLDQEFSTYVLATGSTLSSGSSAKPEELYEVLRILHDRGQIARHASSRRDLFTWSVSQGHGVDCRALALSPSDADFRAFLHRISASMPRPREPKRAAVSPDPNEVSVVLQIQWPDVSVLLGADMTVMSDPGRGWKAVMSEHDSLGMPKSEIVKVPHHGSANAHYELMWEKGLHRHPIAVVAPFGGGRREGRPPKTEDITRILARAPRSYLTSPPRGAARRKFENSVERTLEDGGIEIYDVNTPMGVVRLRGRKGGWTETLLAPAIHLKDAA